MWFCLCLFFHWGRSWICTWVPSKYLSSQIVSKILTTSKLLASRSDVINHQKSPQYCYKLDCLRVHRQRSQTPKNPIYPLQLSTCFNKRTMFINRFKAHCFIERNTCNPQEQRHSSHVYTFSWRASYTEKHKQEANQRELFLWKNSKDKEEAEITMEMA